jgi:dolichol-phosphate mannosyltransferase
MLDVSVVIPTYNESENLPVIIPHICAVLQQGGLNGEVIVVDDNSPDETGRVALALAGRYPVRTLVRTTERGLSTAVLAGFALSEAKVCVVIDADGSHPVERLPDMIRPILDDKADIAVGSRHVQGGAIGQWPLHRQIISKTAALMAFGVTKMSDPTSGFMAVRRTLLDGLELNPIGWKIVLEIVVKTKTDRLLEVPITFNDRQLGQSKMSPTEQWNYIKHLYRLYLHKIPGFIEFIKFCIVGFSGVFVDMGVVIALKILFGLDTRLCAVFGFCAAVTTNYLLNRAWTFQDARHVPLLKSYVTFCSVCSLGFLARLGVMHLLIEFTPLDQGHGYMLINLIGIVVATVINFVGSKFLAFSPTELAFKKGSKC